jgi:ABC-type Fe3+ transport system substrate-binding protein
MPERTSELAGRTVTRRTVLAWVVAGTSGLLAACAPGAPATPTLAPPTTAPVAKPAAAAAPARWGMNAEQAAAWQQIEDAARKEGKITYYAVGNIPQNNLDSFKTRWAKDYPEISIDVLYVGNNAAVMSRVQSEQEAKTYVGDMAETSITNATRVDTTMFTAFTPPAAADPSKKYAFNPVTIADGRPIHSSVMAQYFGYWINTQLIKPEEAPQNYPDVVNKPALKGQIIWRQPWTTGGGNHTWIIVHHTYGDEWATAMQAQDPTFAEDQDAALLQIGRGEYGFGMGLTGRTGGQMIRDGMPLQAIWPEDIGVRVSNGYVIANTAPHTNAAKVLVNWMLTQPGQELWQELGQFPIDTAVSPAEDWMKGYTRSKLQWEDLENADVIAQSLKDAERFFKK